LETNGDLNNIDELYLKEEVPNSANIIKDLKPKIIFKKVEVKPQQLNSTLVSTSTILSNANNNSENI